MWAVVKHCGAQRGLTPGTRGLWLPSRHSSKRSSICSISSSSPRQAPPRPHPHGPTPTASPVALSLPSTFNCSCKPFLPELTAGQAPPGLQHMVRIGCWYAITHAVAHASWASPAFGCVISGPLSLSRRFARPFAGVESHIARPVASPPATFACQWCGGRGGRGGRGGGHCCVLCGQGRCATKVASRVGEPVYLLFLCLRSTYQKYITNLWQIRPTFS